MSAAAARTSGHPDPLIRVRLFAALRDVAGAATLEVEAATVGSLIDQLGERLGPEFVRIMAVGTAIVDDQTAGRERPLRPGDEVALLPPVSGGRLPARRGRRPNSWT